jgi:superfamily II DNA helicase RecQ
LRSIFPGRDLIEYDAEKRPDITKLTSTAIVVATSALKTGTNMPETNLALFYGGAYSLEDWLQGAGRTGREGSNVRVPCIRFRSFAQHLLRTQIPS